MEKKDDAKIMQKNQAVRSIKLGQLHRLSSLVGLSLTNSTQYLTTVSPNDIVVPVAYRLWEHVSAQYAPKYLLRGFEFLVIYKEYIGWIGNGSWPTFEEIRDPEALERLSEAP